MEAPTITDRKAEVWARLQTVTDPELDEPITDLDFVTRVDVDAENRVHIAFRLPTYWCAANFSFLMADDMRMAVKELPWVSATTDWGTIQLDASIKGNPLSLRGATYAKGIGTHAVSNIVYNLAGQYTNFVTDIGVDAFL